nr:MAG TPA: hypothetical protein [Caudoviricetes sp.]
MQPEPKKIPKSRADFQLCLFHASFARMRTKLAP